MVKRTAWAIRLCSRFTSLSAFGQSIVSQLLASLVRQSVWCLNALAGDQRSTAISCFFKFSFVFRVSHPQELQRKSAPSRVRPIVTLSVPLQNGLRFFPDELPGVYSVRLAVTLSVAVWTRHSRQPVYHVSCAQPTSRLGPLRPPVAA